MQLFVKWCVLVGLNMIVGTTIIFEGQEPQIFFNTKEPPWFAVLALVAGGLVWVLVMCTLERWALRRGRWALYRGLIVGTLFRAATQLLFLSGLTVLAFDFWIGAFVLESLRALVPSAMKGHLGLVSTFAAIVGFGAVLFVCVLLFALGYELFARRFRKEWRALQQDEVTEALT